MDIGHYSAPPSPCSSHQDHTICELYKRDGLHHAHPYQSAKHSCCMQDIEFNDMAHIPAAHYSRAFLMSP